MLNQRKMGVILSYVSLIIKAAIGFIYVPVLLYFMGKNEYGLYQLMGSLIAYFSILDFGLSATVVRFYTKFMTEGNQEKCLKILAISRKLYRYITLILIVLGLILFLNLESIFGNSLTSYEMIESKKIFVLLLINIAATFLSNVYTSILIAHEKFIFLKGISIIQEVAQPIIVIALMNISPKAFTMTLVLTLSNIVFSLLKVIVVKIKEGVIIPSKVNSDKVLVRSFLKFSANIFVVSIVDQIFWRSSQTILGIMVGTSMVAMYSIASQIYMNYMPVSTVIQGVFLPKVTKMISDNSSMKELSSLFIRIGRLQYIMLSSVLIGFTLFGKDFINIWVGNEYIDSYYLTILIIYPFTIDLIQNIGLLILQASNLYGFRAKIYTIIAILNIVLTTLLVPKYGVYGAAISLSVSIFLGNGIIMNIYYHYIGIAIKSFWIEIIKISKGFIIPILFGIMYNRFVEVNSFIGLGVEIGIFTTVYLFSVFIFGITSQEREGIINKITHLRKRGK